MLAPGGVLKRSRTLKVLLSCVLWSYAFAGLLIPREALAQVPVNIPAQSLKSALDDYIRQTGIQLIYNADEITTAVSKGAHDASADKALSQLLENTGMTVIRDGSGAMVITCIRHGDSGSVHPGTESVIVTGSRILRDNDFGPLPVTTVTAEQ
jgi:hypothetical protein